MPYCQNCGKYGEGNYCPSCGQAINPPPQAAGNVDRSNPESGNIQSQAPQPEPSMDKFEEPPELKVKEHGTQRLYIVTAIIAAIVIISLLAFILLQSPGENVDEGVDSDGDGMLTEWEMMNGFDPKNPSDAGLDTDSDGLTNLQEFQIGTQPRDNDTDDDSVMDGADVDPFKNVLVVVEITWVEFIDNIDTTFYLQDVRAGDPYLIVTIDGKKFKTAEPIENDVSSISLSVSFTQDVPDTKESISITIELWDDDASGADDDFCDISPTQSRGLTLTYWIKTNSWTGEVSTGYADGSGDGTESSDDDDAAIRFNIHE